jgi:hypothetical protein
MRSAAFLAGSLVAIGAYLFVATIFGFSAAPIGLGVLAIAMTAALGAMAATPAPSRA